MRPRVILSCAGDEERYSGEGIPGAENTPTQLFHLAGERILDRTIRQVDVLLPNADIRVALLDSKNPDFKIKGVRREKVELPPGPVITDALEATQRLWSKDGPTWVLFGDVWWADEDIATVLAVRRGRDCESWRSKDGNEVLGFSLHSECLPEGDVELGASRQTADRFTRRISTPEDWRRWCFIWGNRRGS